MSHSGAKKAHDWAVDQLADLFRTTHKVKTQQVVKIRGQHCGDLELAAYLASEAGPVPLVLDLRIAHDRIGSSANPALNGTLTQPGALLFGLREAVAGTESLFPRVQSARIQKKEDATEAEVSCSLPEKMRVFLILIECRACWHRP